VTRPTHRWTGLAAKPLDAAEYAVANSRLWRDSMPRMNMTLSALACALTTRSEAESDVLDRVFRPAVPGWHGAVRLPPDNCRPGNRPVRPVRRCKDDYTSAPSCLQLPAYTSATCHGCRRGPSRSWRRAVSPCGRFHWRYNPSTGKTTLVPQITRLLPRLRSPGSDTRLACPPPAGIISMPSKRSGVIEVHIDVLGHRRSGRETVAHARRTYSSVARHTGRGR
jgi:hypothetical protein